MKNAKAVQTVRRNKRSRKNTAGRKPIPEQERKRQVWFYLNSTEEALVRAAVAEILKNTRGK